MPEYYPETPPAPFTGKEKEMFEWTFREFNRVAASFNQEAHLTLQQQFVEIDRPQDGDIVYADGTSWNPGSGKGIYAYIDSAWSKLNISSTDDLVFDSATLSGPITINLAAAGTLMTFQVAGVTKGAVSVDGAGFVTYGTFLGAHWSQLSDGTRPEILRGTIVESVSKMCSWPGEPPEQRLPCFKVSDLLGSKAVYGVFSGWDENWTVTNDALIHSVGVGVVRMNAGSVVLIGDYIESNGNGCGKVQSSMMIRSPTVAKITSTTIIQTYPDGSYLVPCSLHCG